MQLHGYRRPRSHQTQPQKRDVWQRNASKKRMSYNLICLWFWIRFIAVPFYLTLSRVGEAENPGPVCATAKLYGAKYDAIGQWAQNLSSKSEVELEPLFAQVGECRQLFSERFGNDAKPYTSPVSQDIHSTRSHLDRSSLPAAPVRVGDPVYTQQFCDSLSLFQEGEQSGRGHHVLSNLLFRGMEGKERSNPFCHRATRGGRKHMPGTTSSLPISTQRSSQRPTLGRKGSCQQSRRQRNLVGLARAAQQPTLSITARVQACSHWSENVGFPSTCQSAVTMLVFSVQTHDWQGGSYASWAGRFCCSQRISSTRSVSAVTATPI